MRSMSSRAAATAAATAGPPASSSAPLLREPLLLGLPPARLRLVQHLAGLRAGQHHAFGGDRGLQPLVLLGDPRAWSSADAARLGGRPSLLRLGQAPLLVRRARRRRLDDPPRRALLRCAPAAAISLSSRSAGRADLGQLALALGDAALGLRREPLDLGHARPRAADACCVSRSAWAVSRSASRRCAASSHSPCASSDPALRDLGPGRFRFGQALFGLAADPRFGLLGSSDRPRRASAPPRPQGDRAARGRAEAAASSAVRSMSQACCRSSSSRS